ISTDYVSALSASLLFYEAQRSGKFPDNQRVQWRGDSALTDGSVAGVDLVGGYYDAGDNVKFGFPMAYTITMLAWGVVEYSSQFSANNQLEYALDAIRWGTDYFIKAHPQPNFLYAEVGDGDSDHACWERPEDMMTPRTVYQIDEQHPGSDLAGETAAALAAASIAFADVDDGYSSELVSHAEQLFDFGVTYQGKYSDSIPAAQNYYPSSWYQDELAWAAAWLHRATQKQKYMDYLGNPPGGTGGPRTMFSWDDKYVGVQILAAKYVLEQRVADAGNWAGYKDQLEQYICNCVQRGNNNVQKTQGGLLFFNPWANIQYVASASLALVVYSDYLKAAEQVVSCPAGLVYPDDLTGFAKSQADYILGQNPKGISYMVGYGQYYPQMVHHRGASIVSIKENPAPVKCGQGYAEWYNRNQPNPNKIVGAIVGGPDQNENYNDVRTNYQQNEPATATSAPLVGALAGIA
ncbi:Endoglucanase 13-like protein, partial [Drosera capensis]